MMVRDGTTIRTTAAATTTTTTTWAQTRTPTGLGWVASSPPQTDKGR